MRDLLADSDSKLDPQAYVLRPDVVIKIAGEIVKEKGYYNRTKKAASATIEELRKAIVDKKLSIDEKENQWLDTFESQIEDLPQDVAEFTKDMIDQCDKLDPKKYDM